MLVLLHVVRKLASRLGVEQQVRSSGLCAGWLTNWSTGQRHVQGNQPAVLLSCSQAFTEADLQHIAAAWWRSSRQG